MDIRLANALCLARTRGEQSKLYAYRALVWARLLGDAAAVEEAERLGALDWEPEACVYGRSEATMQQDIQELLNQIIVSDALTFLQDLPDASVPLYLFSPPYNLGNSSGGGMPGKRLGHYPIDAGLSRRGGPYHAEVAGGRRAGKWDGGALANGYDASTDSMLHEEYIAWQHTLLRECWRTLAAGGAIYYNHKPRILDGLLVEPRDYVPRELPIRQRIIWARAGGINFSPVFYLPTYEEILIIAKPDFRLKSKVASGAGDVWSIPQETDTWHPAPFPLALAQRVIETTMPAFVVDPFCGSGTTCVAARQFGVGYIGCDKSAAYVERARERAAKTRPITLRQARLLELTEQQAMDLA